MGVNYEIKSGAIYASNDHGMSWVVMAHPSSAASGPDDVIDQYDNGADLSISEWLERFDLDYDNYGHEYEALGDWEYDVVWTANTYNDGNLDITNKILRVFLLTNTETLETSRWMAISHNTSDPRGGYTIPAFYEIPGDVDDEEAIIWFWADLEPRYSFDLEFVDGSAIRGYAEAAFDTYSFECDDDCVTNPSGSGDSMADLFYEEYGGYGSRLELDDAVDRILSYGSLESDLHD